MVRCCLAVPLIAATLCNLVCSLPQETGQSKGLRKAVFGSTYDEIVVETQLAVRPKAPGPGVGSRTGRAKAVFFRPMSSPSPSAPTAAAALSTPTSPSPSTASTARPGPSDGLTFAARVVGVENPMARSKRVRRHDRQRRRLRG